MKTIYNPPLKAKYKYRKFLYEQGLAAPVKVVCEVLEETERQYKIRLLEPCDNYPVRWELWAKKYNIELAEPKVTKTYDYSGAFWND